VKVFPFTIPKTKGDALILQEDKGHSFYELLHRHQELQLSYVVTGEGSLIVGDTVNFYNVGDILVLGGSLPHVFKSNQKENTSSYMISVFFTKDSFGELLFGIEELKSLKTFFKKTENGFKITSNKKAISLLFEQLLQASKFERFILFFQLLKKLNTAKHEALSSFISQQKYSDNEGQRMSSVFKYTMNHFKNDIPLQVISEQAAMTKNACCKYFKKRTNKTYVAFLNELRIEESCKLLQEQPEMSIPEVAELSGFKNISNFNRKFKKLKKQTPLAYKKLMT
jgi:AraC-like DNA-binding protein